MFRLLGLMLCIIPFALGTVFAQDTLWVRQFDLGSDEELFGIASRGQTVVGVGRIIDTLNYDNEALVVKFNQSGETLWTKVIDLGGNEQLIDVAIDQEQNIYIAGGGNPVETGRWRPLDLIRALSFQMPYCIITKFDSLGEVKWQNVTPSYQAIGVAVDTAGNCYASGLFFTGSEYDLAVAKFLPNGDTAWVRSFNTAFYEILYRSALDQNGNLVSVGIQWDFITSTISGILTKINPIGETLWLKTFSLDSFTALIGVDVDIEGNIVATGFCGTSKNVDLLVLKTDSTGNSLWSSRLDYTEDDEGLGVACDSERFIFVTGFFEDRDCRLLKISPAGELIWDFRYDHSGFEYFQDITLDEIGNPLCAGLTDLSSHPYDLLLAKFSPEISGVAEEKVPTIEKTTGFISQGELFLQVPVAGRHKVELFDLAGKKVSDFPNLHLNAGKNRLLIGGLSAGVYIVRITEPSNRVATHKAMIIK